MLQIQTVGVIVGSRDPVLTFLLMSFNRITVRSRVPRGGRESTPCHHLTDKWLFRRLTAHS